MNRKTYVIFSRKFRNLQSPVHRKPVISISGAKVQAAAKATDIAFRNNLGNLKIVTDSMMFQNYDQVIQFKHVPGHSNDNFNDLANKLAK